MYSVLCVLMLFGIVALGIGGFVALVAASIYLDGKYKKFMDRRKPPEQRRHELEHRLLDARRFSTQHSEQIAKIEAEIAAIGAPQEQEL